MRIVSSTELGNARWNAFCESFPTAWFWWTSAWRQYSLAYRPDAVDHSFAVCDGEDLVGLCSLIQEGDRFAMGGNPCPWPLAPNDEIMAVIMAEVDRLARLHGVAVGQWRSSPLAATPTVKIPHTQDRSIMSQVVDLRQPLDAIWREVSDGHRAEIHRGLRELEIASGTPEEFRVVHAVAHGYTRSASTWDANRAWWNAGWADILMADRGNNPVGGAYFLRYKDSVYYTSAAWPEPHVAHAVVWTAIRRYREQGYRALELGWLNTGSLAVFKRGFSRGSEVQMLVAAKQWRRQ